MAIKLNYKNNQPTNGPSSIVKQASGNSSGQSLTGRIVQIAKKWFLSEPLLFGAWASHQVVANFRIDTIRVGRGRVEYNPDFLASLNDKTLREVMKFEALRIILKHPYERRKPNLEFALTASNISIRECVGSSLTMPTAFSTFNDAAHNNKYFEYYYNLLAGTRRSSQSYADEGDADEGDADEGDSEQGGNDNRESEPSESLDGSCEKCGGECSGGKCSGSCSGGESDGLCKKTAFGKKGKGKSKGTEDTGGLGGGSDRKNSLQKYCDAKLVCVQNASQWDHDQFISEQINDLITEIEASNCWGTIAGDSRELILATRVPKLDYRRVLKSFRANVLSTQRRLTRMKPSRRYGFDYMGSRRDFSTSLLFAVDVSGSVGTADVRNAFSIVNRLFKYGIESIDVIWFDTEVCNEKPLTLSRARRETAVEGRGGTDFQPLMDYLDKHRTKYDGMIVFTDGIAPVPEPPKLNRRTRIAWLFNHETNWKQRQKDLQLPGMVSAFVYAD